MPRYILALALITFLGSGLARASESEFVVVGSMDVAFKNLSLDVGSAQPLNAPLSTVNPNIVFAYGKMYASLGYDGAVGSSSVQRVEDGSPQVLTMSRSDTFLTFGYRITEPLSLFGGWLQGNINALQTGVRERPPTPSGTFDSYVQTIIYATQGPFVGTAYTLPIGKKSALNVSVAYAKLAGSTTEDTSIVYQGSSHNYTSFDVKGLSYGITWSGELSGSLGYRVGVKRTNYQGDATAQTPGGISENYTSYFFGISNFF